MGTIIYLTRHGETEWNIEKRLQGRGDSPLTKDGIQRAKELRDRIKNIDIDVIYSSPIKRALNTANILRGNKNIDIVTDDRLMEMCFGDYEGTSMVDKHEDMKIYFERPKEYVVKNGVEPYEDVFARINSFLDELTSNPRYKDSNIFVATHGGMLRGFLYLLKDIDLNEYWGNGLHKNGAVTIVEIKDGKRKILQEGIILYDESRI
jgi:probable phosphoglycerate mutase